MLKSARISLKQSIFGHTNTESYSPAESDCIELQSLKNKESFLYKEYKDIDTEESTSVMDSIVFYVSLGYNLALHDRVKKPWWHVITDDIVLGALPFHDRNHLHRLITKEGIGGVVSLCKDYELDKNLVGTPVAPSHWEAQGVECLHIPTADFDTPTIQQLFMAVIFIYKIIDGKKRVYVHCKAGRGRSVVVVACFLIQKYNITTEESIQMIAKKRPHINLGVHQIHTCKTFENEIKNRNTTPLTLSTM